MNRKVVLIWNENCEDFLVYDQSKEHDDWLASNGVEYCWFTPAIKSKDLLGRYLVWACQRGDVVEVRGS